ncbi:transcriptional regulator (plasmid) [Rhodococcus opacus]|uniref:Transcriptional regulator n=1 Tax=Rhodococcus opacus TaxID=37919 RepID=A0A1B1KH08_RHOOP|nr:TetR/AcrR family transcriptional regulator [Rhodococcus opacus]ANS31887.1 transcriptional regulator [Rhodococcus opacus]
MTTRLDRDADATRARLLEAATTAFAEKGFKGTTTRDIASAAGMSPAALYVHHKSKEELLYLISRSGHDRILRLMQEANASSEAPTATLHRVIHDFAIDHARGPAAARITNYEMSSLTPEHLAEIRDIRRRTEHELHKLVEAGVAAGDFDTPDPRMATVALLSLGIDIARWYRDGGRWSPEYIAKRYADMALRIVGAS